MSCDIFHKKYIKKKTKYSNSKKETNKYNTIDPNSKCRFLVHEIINPLNIISNCTELLKCNMSNNDTNCEKMNEFLDIIHNQISICNNISQCILDNNNNCSLLNIDDFISDYIRVFSNIGNINIATKFNDTKKHLIFLKKNKIYLKIILDNIFKNILDYSKVNNVHILTNVSNKKLTVLIKNVLIDGKCNKYEIGKNIIELSELSELDTKQQDILNNGDVNSELFESYEFSNKKRGNGIGLELINKFCKLLNINWYLTQDDNNNYYYVLQIYLNTN